MRDPAGLLRALEGADASRPRLTVYDDTPAAGGERVELSAHVLANWVAKAGTALQDEWDVGPGSRVALALPPHWRSVYWAFATWAVGGCLVLTGPGEVTVTDDPDVTVTDDPGVLAGQGAGTGTGHAGPAVLVTLAALARSAPVAPPADAMDEARELAAYADQLVPFAEPTQDDPALVVDGVSTAYGSLLDLPAMPERVRVHTATTDLPAFLRALLGAWAADGSVVLSRGADGADLSARLASEGVTLDLG